MKGHVHDRREAFYVEHCSSCDGGGTYGPGICYVCGGIGDEWIDIEWVLVLVGNIAIAGFGAACEARGRADERAEADHERGRMRLRLKMAADAMATDPRDWSVNRTDAWLWAVIIGWGSAVRDVAARHGSAFHGASSLGDDHDREPLDEVSP